LIDDRKEKLKRFEKLTIAKFEISESVEEINFSQRE